MGLERHGERGLDTLAREINEEHRGFGGALNAAKGALNAAGAHAVRAGKLLKEAKAQCKHGDWYPWLEANFEGSQRTAQAYMQVAANPAAVEAAKAQNSAGLSINRALKQLAAPSKLTRAELEKGGENFDVRAQLEKSEEKFAEQTRAWVEQPEEEDSSKPSHLTEISGEAWKYAFDNANSVRVERVAKHLYKMYAWPQWMGDYFPGEAVDAIANMVHGKELIEALRYVDDWLQRVIEEWDERGNRG